MLLGLGNIPTGLAPFSSVPVPITFGILESQLLILPGSSPRITKHDTFVLILRFTATKQPM